MLLLEGQQAMALAMLYPKPMKHGRGIKSVLSTEFSQPYLSLARTVLTADSTLANEAYLLSIVHRRDRQRPVLRFQMRVP